MIFFNTNLLLPTWYRTQPTYAYQFVQNAKFMSSIVM